MHQLAQLLEVGVLQSIFHVNMHYYCNSHYKMQRLLLAAAASAVAARVGDGWGTNIHWTKETQPGEASMLSVAFKLARMDFNWGSIENPCGSYDFSAYDTLLSTMQQVNVRPYWILDYGNNCYPAQPGQPPQSCSTAECIQAFGRFAQAAVTHFKGNDIIWECLNEPNGMGGDNATDITSVCQSAGAAIQAAGEIFVGPTTAGMDWTYLNSTFQDGILSAFTNVSVHPYRAGPPDSVIDDWVRLRGMVTQYAPSGKQDMGLISGEWGYTSALPPCTYSNRVNETMQGWWLARMWLSNLYSGVPVSIAYDWRDDGVNASDCESNFGSVRAQATGNPSQPFQPKPFYVAAYTLQSSLGNADHLAGRLPAAPAVPGPQPRDVFALLFQYNPAAEASSRGSLSSSSGTALAVWTNYSTNGTCGATAAVPDRLDCGFYGISQQQCSGPPPQGRGCCWEPNQPVVGGPQCYYVRIPAPGFNVTVDTSSAAPAGSCWTGTDTFGTSLGQLCSDSNAQVVIQAGQGPTYLL